MSAKFNAQDFCFFKENRNPIAESKFIKLRKSIKTTGYCIMPIIVMPCEGQDNLVDLDGNPTSYDKHKYAVIDGQNRMLACIAEGLTPWYIVNSYADREDVITANNTSTPWQLADFIQYWQIRLDDEDNDNYDDLWDAMNKYANTVAKGGLFAPGVVAESFSRSGGSYKAAIENGDYEFDYYKGTSMLSTATLFSEVEDFKFNHQRFVRAIGVILRDAPDFNFGKVVKKMKGGVTLEIAKEGLIVDQLKVMAAL